MPRRRPSRGCQASALLCPSEEGAHLQERQTARGSGLLCALPPRRRDHRAALALLPYASCAPRDHPARRVTMPVRRCPSARAAQPPGSQGPHRSMMRLGQGSHEACPRRGGHCPAGTVWREPGTRWEPSAVRVQSVQRLGRYFAPPSSAASCSCRAPALLVRHEHRSGLAAKGSGMRLEHIALGGL